MEEVYVVYGVDASGYSTEKYRFEESALLGSPDFLSIFDTRTAAMEYFRKKVLEIARDKELNKKFFSHLKDEELFIGTYQLRKYEDDEIFTLPVFIQYDEEMDYMRWEFYKDDFAYDIGEPFPPRVYMKKRRIWSGEVETEENR